MILSTYGALGLAALLFLSVPSRRWSRRSRVLAAACSVALTQLPVQGLALAGYWRAAVGDLAIPSTLLLVTLAGRRLLGHAPLLEVGERAPLRVLGVFACAFYPLAMGAARWDPYRVGFSPGWLLPLVGALALWSWWRGRPALVLALSLATLAFAVDALRSHNYWDYLFDPVLSACGCVLVLADARHFVQRRVNR